MAGFCLIAGDRRVMSENRPQVVDLGECEHARLIETNRFKLAWKSPAGATQWRVYEDSQRCLLIEGQPDREPHPGESLANWLPHRWGSFRGLEIRSVDQDGPVRITAFVDPLGTRPLFHVVRGDVFLAADKLATLLVNADPPLTVNWGAIIESLVLGTYESPDTTLDGVRELRPGEVVEFCEARATTRQQNLMPMWPGVDPETVRRDPVGSLLEALRTAVTEVWTDPECWLTLSGGLDSRMTLALAGPGRKALTVTTRENRESRLAREIAVASGAEFRHFTRPVDTYPRLARDAFLLNGCVHPPLLAHFLYLAPTWRRAGIHSVTHAFLYDTLLKGCFLRPRGVDLPVGHPLARLVGPLGWVFTKSPLGYPDAMGAGSELVLSLLSRDGYELARERLKELSGRLQSSVSGSYDCTQERMVLQSISREMHYGLFLALIESVDVQSPIFHPALWTWHRYSAPKQRDKGRAFRKAILRLGHPVSRIPDGNTGGDVLRGSRKSLLERLSHYPGYAAARAMWRRVRSRQQLGAMRKTALPMVGKTEDDGSWALLPPLMRAPAARLILEEGCSHLRDNPLFDYSRVERALHVYQNGTDDECDVLTALGAVGRWSQFCRQSHRENGTG